MEENLGNELFVWGGMWEEKDRRFTLDDIWSLDLNKLEQWKERLPNSNIGMEWQGSDDEWDEVEDDDEEEGEARRKVTNQRGGRSEQKRCLT